MFPTVDVKVCHIVPVLGKRVGIDLVKASYKVPLWCLFQSCNIKYKLNGGGVLKKKNFFLMHMQSGVVIFFKVAQ